MPPIPATPSSCRPARPSTDRSGCARRAVPRRSRSVRRPPTAQLPAAGVRITPAAAPLLAKIRSTTAGPAMRTDSGATYWTLKFLEFLPSSSSGSANLVEFGGAGSTQTTLSTVPKHLVIDRCYLHGNASYGQRRGLALNSGDAQILNSYFADIKGVLQDTQAIMGWNGPGPYLIENNYLEAAGENVMFGGTDPSIPNLVPANITIRRNLISRPLAWMSQVVDREEPHRVQERRERAGRGQHDRESLGRGPVGLRSHLHAAQPERRRTLVGGARHHRAQQHHSSRRGGLQHLRLGRHPQLAANREHRHREQPGVRREHRVQDSRPERERLVRGDGQRAEERELRAQHRRPQRQQPDSPLQRQGPQRRDEDLRSGGGRQQLARRHVWHRRRQPRARARFAELLRARREGVGQRLRGRQSPRSIRPATTSRPSRSGSTAS